MMMSWVGGAWQEWEMKARHLTKAQGPKVLLHAQNPAHYAHYAHLKLKYRHKRCDVPTHYTETMLVKLKRKDYTTQEALHTVQA